jgi:hypothetical protein
MSENDNKKLDEVLLDTVKELSRIVKEQARLLEVKELKYKTASKHDTCCKYKCCITISAITISILICTTIVLCCGHQEFWTLLKSDICYKYICIVVSIIIIASCAATTLCCIFGRCNLRIKIEGVPDTIKVQILKEE